jgi:acylglycerol lipase
MSPHHREKVVDGTFRSASSGHELFTRAWLPRGDASPPRALLLLAHGIHEHVGRFDALATALARAKVAVYGWDHVGHGRSGGELRHQFGRDGFDGVVDDAVQYARRVVVVVVVHHRSASHWSPYDRVGVVNADP